MIEKFNKDYFQHLFPQRTRLKTEYGLSLDSSQDSINSALSKMASIDYEMIKDFLPEKADNILDIGCGLGLINIALSRHYSGNVNLHLLDKTNFIDEDTPVRGFNKKYVFYNSMDATKETLTDNLVNPETIHTYDVNEENLVLISKKKYDVVLSLLSCGWHYSVEEYTELIKETLDDDGVLILDIRHDTGQLEIVKEQFNLIGHRINTAESKHTGGTIGDRYFFGKK